jgi:predicted short-subunit dehydrogenase-like oxidoreductase (DUF2520 family)
MILLIGRGRAALHLDHYFKSLGLVTSLWHYSEPVSKLVHSVSAARSIFFLVPDKQIPLVLEAHREILTTKAGSLFHCSGALTHPEIRTLHPLMTFPKALFPSEFYPKIAFTTTQAFGWHEIDSKIANPLIHISEDQQALYHAQCVLAANMTHLLWINFSHEMQRLGFTPAHLAPYLDRISKNYMSLGSEALTGPLVRQDEQTLEKNLKALEGDPFHEVYSSFVTAYQQKISHLRSL